MKSSSKEQSHNLPVATHSGVVTFGDVGLKCHNFEDGTRIFSGPEMLNVVGIPIDGLADFIDSDVGKHLDPESYAYLTSPVRFLVPFESGYRDAFGYHAPVLISVCDAFLEARSRGELPDDHPSVRHCQSIMIAFAKMGMTALVDEASGHQEERSQGNLEQGFNSLH